MKTPVKLLLLIAICGALATTACKKSKDTETAADARPSRPASPSGTMSLHGAYWRVGDAGTFRDCTTNGQWRVANEGDNQALEQAYVESGVQPGAPLVVTVEGGIDYRPRPDGSGREVMLVIARFVQLGPGDVCPSTSGAPSE
jgi:uncharacterized lipoprotein NlpE involved in copper resistance